jgi:hypothetical protein
MVAGRAAGKGHASAVDWAVKKATSLGCGKAGRWAAPTVVAWVALTAVERAARSGMPTGQSTVF